MSTLLEIEHLNKTLGGFTLDDINLKLEPGYIMGLLGVNGSGKTTLINTILNLYKKDSGTIRINGCQFPEAEKEAKDKIGFVLDQNVFDKTTSILGNARTYGRLYSNFNENMFCELCDRFDLSLSQKVGKLSTGMSVRFQLAFALSHNAKLYIMDEPAAGLDPIFRQELLGYMQELIKDGTRSVLFSTHITEDLDVVGDYVTFIRNGRLFLTASIAELQERYVLLQGTKQQIESLQCAKIIYREYGLCHNIAFVEKSIGDNYMGTESQFPLLEDVMYYFEKGDVTYA